jgi:hypothetical protein
MDQKIEPPNDAEIEWVQTNVTGHPQGCRRRGGTGDRRALRGLVRGVGGQPDEDREDPNPMINAFGLAFGQVLVDELGLEGAVVTDEHGTEIAVHAKPHDLIVFPPNLVAKRSNAATHFLAPIYEGIGNADLRGPS